MKTASRYKWDLRKGSHKEICPRCGQRRFVPYVLAADGTTLAGAEYGRCDREQNCGYYRYPGKDIMPDVKPQKPAAPVHIPAPYVFSPEVAQPKHSTLLDYAVELCGSVAHQIWDAYKIGCNREGRTIFWYIDKNGVIRSGKEILYRADGHRDKTTFLPVMWAHKDGEFMGKHTGEVLLQPFFGEHLLKARPDAKVAIVESEKTAALMSAFYPKDIWIACGGAQGLKSADKCKVLKGRKVVLIPDHGQFWNWKATAEKYGWEIFDFIEKSPLFEGCDILDYYDHAKQINK